MKEANIDVTRRLRQKERELKEITSNVSRNKKLMEKSSRETAAAQTAQSQAQTTLKKLQEEGFLKVFCFEKGASQPRSDFSKPF